MTITVTWASALYWAEIAVGAMLCWSAVMTVKVAVSWVRWVRNCRAWTRQNRDGGQ